MTLSNVSVVALFLLKKIENVDFWGEKPKKYNFSALKNQLYGGPGPHAKHFRILWGYFGPFVDLVEPGKGLLGVFYEPLRVF